MSNTPDTLTYKWVIASYDPRSDRGKSAIAHADAGIGYILQNRNRTKGENVIVAFKYPSHKLVPRHLIEATAMQTESLENRSHHG